MENYAILQLENEIITFKKNGFAHKYKKDLKDAVDKIKNLTDIEIDKEVIDFLKLLSNRIELGLMNADSPEDYWNKRQQKRLSQVNEVIKILE